MAKRNDFEVEGPDGTIIVRSTDNHDVITLWGPNGNLIKLDTLSALMLIAGLGLAHQKAIGNAG